MWAWQTKVMARVMGMFWSWEVASARPMARAMKQKFCNPPTKNCLMSSLLVSFPSLLPIRSYFNFTKIRLPSHISICAFLYYNYSGAICSPSMLQHHYYYLWLSQYQGVLAIVALLRRSENIPKPKHNQLDPFTHLKSYTPIVWCFFVVAQALSDFKTSTILLYVILNGKGRPTGCGLHGYSLVSILF